MYDSRKVILMTKLALCDKENTAEDIHTDNFFRHDYIYRQNMWLRLFVLIGSFVLIAFRILHMLAIEKIDLFKLDFQAELINAGIFILVLQILYTVIGTILYTIAYERAQKRMQQYFALMDELESLRSSEQFSPQTRKEPLHANRTSSMDSRNHHKVL